MPQVNTLVADITVAEVVAPQLSKAGKMMPARIKDTSGRVWNVWKDRFEQMDVGVGRTYAAMYTSTPYSFVNPHTGAEQTGENNTIVGLNPINEKKESIHSLPPVAQTPADEKSEDIAVLAMAKVPELTALARQGDVSTGVKTMKTLRLMWREYKKQAAIMPSGNDFDDEIPY